GYSYEAIGTRGQSQNNYGVYGQSFSTSGVFGYSNFGYGVEGNGTNNHGVHGTSTNSFGVYGTSEGASAIYGYSTSQVGVSGVSGNSYGVIGSSANFHGVLGSTASASHFDFYASSTGGNNYGSASSRRWKENICNIPNPLEMIAGLRGVYYDWDEEHGGNHSIGFIAEEVGEVIPEIVVYEENGIDAIGMDYSKMTPLLVEAINALCAKYDKKFSDQQKHIQELEARVNELMSATANINN
ncbi:MAG: tail fiber domain-containing protein, partial [Saprospiraceae bacterium]|nr:tail fiber domain-containing protein [Saprospiraceae bacterium]